jgi:multidrug resistance efflux pump
LSAHSKLGSGVVAIVFVIATAAFFWSSRDRKTVQAHQTPSNNAAEVVFASTGRVEGLSDTTQVGAAADGVLKTIYVKEHQFVTKGTLMGEIACDDLNAMSQTALAEADGIRQARTRLLRGARDEEKRIAAKKTEAAHATLAETTSRLSMQHALYEGGEISRSAYEQADRDFGVAQADYQAAVRTEELLAAPPLEEDKARADAEVLAAEGRVRTAQERIRKCAILAPISGTVLRVFARAGESFSTVTPRPLFSLADTSARRVKAEVDERDLGKVAVGQSVIIQADGLGGKKLTGTVASVSAVMGRKSVYTDDPSDKIDRDVLEVVIDLTHDAQSLPIGLRVTVQFLSSRVTKR